MKRTWILLSECALSLDFKAALPRITDEFNTSSSDDVPSTGELEVSNADLDVSRLEVKGISTELLRKALSIEVVNTLLGLILFVVISLDAKIGESDITDDADEEEVCSGDARKVASETKNKSISHFVSMRHKTQAIKIINPF